MRSHLRRIIQTSIPQMIGICLTVGGAAIGLHCAGYFQGVDTRLYDWTVRSLPQRGLDPRLLIIEINEDDLKELKRLTPDDRTLAQALAILQKHQARTIGVDLFRDLPQEPGHAQLTNQLKVENVIAIQRLGQDGSIAVPAPQGVSPDRIGFNDVVVDRDGVVRRNLLIGSGGDQFSFALQLAFRYLNSQGIEPQQSPEGNLTLGQTTFVPLEKSSGGYARLDPRGHQILLQYRSSRVARRLPLRDLLAQRFDPRWIDDKVILIGNQSVSGKDFFYTPYSADQGAEHQMSGIEIHAQMLSQILDASLGTRPLVSDIPDRLEWLWIVTWSLASGLVAWLIRQPWQLGLAQGLMFVVVAGSSMVLLMAQIWMPTAAALTGAIATQGLMLGYRAQTMQRQSRMTMLLLGQNTSKEVANALWQNRHELLQAGKLSGQRLTATMMFTDLQGFSTIAEKLSAEALMDWLNEYLSAMTEEIQRYQGVVNKFTGDGLFAVFGVPIARTTAAEIDQDAQNAVACSIAMGERLALLNQQWQQRGLASVRMRVGICTGGAIVGSLGGKERMEYGIIGDTVNIASRLESTHKERHEELCRVLIAKDTEIHLGDRFALEDWGDMPLKGKQNLVAVFRVLQ